MQKNDDEPQLTLVSGLVWNDGTLYVRGDYVVIDWKPCLQGLAEYIIYFWEITSTPIQSYNVLIKLLCSSIMYNGAV